MNNPETEKIVLAAAIMSPSEKMKVLSQCDMDDFCDISHKYIFETIQELTKKDIKLSLATLNQEYINKKLTLLQTTIEILDSWTGEGIQPSIDNLKDYTCRRKFFEYSLKIKEASANKGIPIQDIIFDIEKNIKILMNKNMNLVNLKDMESGDVPSLVNNKFLKIGYSDIDKKIHGFSMGDLIILAALSGYGKSSFALNVALNIAKNDNVLFFCLEMTALQIRRRAVASKARVNSYKIKTGYFDDDSREKCIKAMKDLSTYKLAIVDNKFNLIDILNICKQYSFNNSLSLIVIDYLQLINHNMKSASREQIVSDITRELKLLAVALNVPVMLLAQLNRQVEHREVKRPVLADLRESGAIGQHADMVWFLYQDKEVSNNVYQFEIAKNRDGIANEVIDLYFNKEFSLFEDI